MVKTTITSVTPSTVPASGWEIGYRPLGNTDAYTISSGSPYNALPIEITTTDPGGTLYDMYIKRLCGADDPSTTFFFRTTCNCTDQSYVVSASGVSCEKTTIIPATVTNSGYCLAASVNAAYTNYGSRIYTPGFTLSSILTPFGDSEAHVYQNLTTASQWANTGLSTNIGPMNRDSVWIDSNCDGTKDPLGNTIDTGSITDPGSGYPDGVYLNIDLVSLTGIGTRARATVTVSSNQVTNVAITDGGQQYSIGDTLSVSETGISGGTGFVYTVNTVQNQKTTISTIFNNVGVARNIYFGIGGDNQFKIVVNGATIIDTGSTSSTLQFKIWHIIPVPMKVGINYINIIGEGDASVDDALAMVLYDNTADQIAAATSDANLTIPFRSGSLRGTNYDVATCPDNYSMDASGGVGNYVCKHTDYKVCNSAS